MKYVEHIINMLPNAWVRVLFLLALLILSGILKVAFDQIKIIINKREKELQQGFDKLNETLQKLDNKIDTLSEKLDLDSKGTKASLYYSIDQLLTQVELFGVWSSQLKETYEKMYDSYMGLGDGMDGGRTFSSRSEKIEVDDTKFHDVISKYNKNRRKLFLDHLEKVEEMF